SLVNSYIHASTTIPKTYTNNTFTGANTFNGNLTVGTLNGPLQTNAGLVSATTSIGVLYGGTGLTAAPSYGQLLLGNSSSGYTLTATSSLGLSSPWTTSGSNIYRLTGNVGIGTTTPVAPLHISSDTDYGLSLSRATTTGANNFIQFINGTGLTYDAYVGSVSAVVAGETDYTAFTFSGAGTSGVNGTYVQSGTLSGKAAYNKDILFSPLILVWTGDMWIVEDGVGWYYKNSTDSTYPPETGWELFITGDAPAPTLAFNSSPGPSLSHLTFGTNPTPASSATLAERMRITSSGNIGIGTTTPYSKLSVWGGGTGGNRLFELTNSASTTLASVLNNGTAYFAGNVGIGTTTPYKKLSVSGEIAGDAITLTSTSVTSTIALALSVGTTTTVTNGRQLFVDGTIFSSDLYGGSATLSTDANGNIIRTPSDAKLKTKVTPVTNALEKVLSLNGVYYNWKDTNRFGSERELGFIAQEVEEVVPEVVRSGGEYKSLNYQNLTALLAGAVQELNSKINDFALKTGNVVISTVTRIKELVVGKLIIKNEDDVSQTGFVIYDRATGKPICVYFENGDMKTEYGECEVKTISIQTSGGGSSQETIETIETVETKEVEETPTEEESIEVDAVEEEPVVEEVIEEETPIETVEEEIIEEVVIEEVVESEPEEEVVEEVVVEPEPVVEEVSTE
ncbi:MAG: tail fiber domain-containing protein, partial [Parcubacteria group bacterium]|nr:tail fiber domain-containing protein [Parcubacteria group bacterium]